MKNKYILFKGLLDTVKLNENGLDFHGDYLKEEKFRIRNIIIEPIDFQDCIKENGIEKALNCNCYLRYELSNNFHLIKDAVFDEIDLVNIRENEK
jgi:hypothetical protein